MQPIHVTFFLYGMSVMFYFISAWILWVKKSMPATRYLAGLLVFMIIEDTKNAFFICPAFNVGSFKWYLMTSFDTIGLPLYTGVFLSLVRPYLISLRWFAINLAPFVLMFLTLTIFRLEWIFFVNATFTVIYAISYSIVGAFALRRYNITLREQFSYEENINLFWLKYILLGFLAIYAFWVMDVLESNVDHRNMFLTGNLVCWFAVTYFFFRHEQVIDELRTPPVHFNDSSDTAAQESANDRLAATIHVLFHEKRFYLNPRLKLSDVATAVGSNRTYISQFFNRGDGSFFDYVNNLRVEHACRLLATSSAPLADIADQSGFNSLATFHRVFSKIKGCSPAKYRDSLQAVEH